MSYIETSSTSPITLADGTFAAQVGLAFGVGFVQRLTLALASTAEYIVKIESSGDTNYADLALFARMAAASPQYWAQQMAWTVVMDSTISATCTDQQLLDRVWTVWPVFSYKASTVLYPTTGV